MDSPLRLRTGLVAALCSAATCFASAQGFTADYDIARIAPADAPTTLRLTPARALGGEYTGGLSLEAGRNWFGQVGLAQGPVSGLMPASSNDILNVAGGYRWSNGQSLSLQLSRGRGTGQRLGLAVNYDWPHYFVRFAYDPSGLTLTPQDSLRFSAGVRF
jgi:hypothetical protein